MLSLSPLAHSIQFHNPFPRVTVTDVQSSTSDLTTYTFTGCNLGDLGSVAAQSDDAYGTNPHVRSRGRKMVAVVVHGEDAATTFNVSSVTIGGVGGTERVDRGGGTSAINTAIYTWDTNGLQGITGTDIAVTWSEAVTSCAIGVLLVENLGVVQYATGGSAQGTGDISVGLGAGLSDYWGYAALIGATCATGSGTELPEFLYTGATNTTSAFYEPMLLYSGSTAEMDFAAAWSYVPQSTLVGANGTMFVRWSGTGAGDAAQIVIR